MDGRGKTLFRLFGFRVKVDFSWIVLGFLVTWTLAKGYFPGQYKNLSETAAWMMGAAGAAGLFFSIVFHEFWHSFVARKRGMPMKGITLFIFGGIAEMDEQPPDPGTEFLMAVAGPVSSVLLGLIFLGVHSVYGDTMATPFAGVIHYLGMINLVLAGFNLLPAFPLDGGRIFRSALWAWKKDLRRATEIASRIGSGFGWFLIVTGVINAFGGNVVGGLWWVMIGFFLKSASRASYKQVLLRKVLQGDKVGDFMKEDPVTVSPDTTLDTLIHHIIYKHHYKMYPVVEKGALAGCVHIHQIKSVPENERAQKTVRDIAEACTDENTVSSGTDALKAFKRLQKSASGRLMVVRDGKLSGVLTRHDVMNVISLKLDMEE